MSNFITKYKLNKPSVYVPVIVVVVVLLLLKSTIHTYIPAGDKPLIPNLVLVQLNDQLVLGLEDGRELTIHTIKDAQTGTVADSTGIYLLMPQNILNQNIAEVTRLLERHQRLLAARSTYLKQQVAELEYFSRTHLKNDQGYNESLALLDQTKRLSAQTDELLDMVNMAVKTKYKRPRYTFKFFHTDLFTNSDDVYHDMKSGNTFYGKLRNNLREGFGKEYSQVDFYQGNWVADKRQGLGISLERKKGVCCGEWEDGEFLGEAPVFSQDRIYGIDISRYQHELNHVATHIDWDSLKITSLGYGDETETVDNETYPISFIYIKSTEGANIKSQHYTVDKAEAQKRNIRVGSYHFFSMSPGQQQAEYFLANTTFEANDMPPVVDVELTDKQVERMGGATVLQQELKTWINTVKARTGKNPIVYANQTFIEMYLSQMVDEPDCPLLWIAFYNEYKPYEHHVIWQLSEKGKVSGITGPADIDVFNGSKELFDQLMK